LIDRRVFSYPEKIIMSNDILIIIPAYNARTTIGVLIDKIHDQSSSAGWDLLVIDDGSADSTNEVAAARGAAVVCHPHNLGKGEALKTGFRYAIENKYSTVVTMDADLQHDPASLPALIRYFLEGPYDLVIGSRPFDRTKMSPVRILSNTITTGLLSWRAGQQIADSQSGYRVLRTDMLKNLHLSTSRFELESELIIRAGRSDYRIGSFPIETIYAGESSHIRHIRDTLRFIKMFLATYLDT
jgi:glycosyltransferase involved in cell wall biosynthesis